MFETTLTPFEWATQHIQLVGWPALLIHKKTVLESVTGR
jgi:hypothetical protein